MRDLQTAAAAEQFERRYVAPHQGRTLVVGSRIYGAKADRRRLYADAIGVDMLAGPGVDVVQDLEDTAAAVTALGRFNHIECLSVLEHSRRPWLLAKTLEKLLVRGGTLHLQVPFVWRLHDYPGDFWRFTAEALPVLFPSTEWRAIRYASDRLRPDAYLPAQDGDGGQPYFPRCEVCGFGVRT